MLPLHCQLKRKAQHKSRESFYLVGKTEAVSLGHSISGDSEGQLQRDKAWWKGGGGQDI